ncbi:uncharacterized protein LOC110154521 [Boleophthalmus pectinirostris]|uniref:uncharacterized protein LOC110154521 n=1 Tax=Boleophthalmus pectinirostris TaxID=150288 RepID=UPI00243182BE|nr:uncharacterized protein LOC110154521 [Boleophthalmus pectinirostris]
MSKNQAQTAEMEERRTAAESEEDLSRPKQEDQRTTVLLQAGVQTSPSWNPGPGLDHCPNQGLIQAVKQEIPDTLQIKEEPEEQGVKQEEEPLPVCVPEYFTVSVKSEEQTEPKEETKGVDISTEPQLHTETEGDTEHSSDNDNDEDWRAPFSCSDSEDHNNQGPATQNSGLSSKHKSAPETNATVNNGDKSGTAEGAESKTHQCPFCKKGIKGTKQSLLRHIRIHTGERPYSCPTCNKTFTTKSQLRVHIRTHTGEKPYSCSDCNKTFTQVGALKAHKRTHTGEKPFSCSICKKEFSEVTGLKRHMNQHTGEKPFSCSTCDKTFSTKFNLHVHIRTHTGEKPYSCTTCNNAFSTKSDLCAHERSHTGERPYSCSDCDKTFSYIGSLNTHRKTHTGEKPFSCSTCNKTFSCKSNLLSHTRKHTGEKPYSCSTCNKTFSHLGTLNAHSRTHTGEKPFSCSICKKEFPQPFALKRHMVLHTGEKPFSCSICNKTFARKCNLNRHRTIHNWFSTDSIASAFSPSWLVEFVRNDLTLFKAEQRLSASAVVMGIVITIFNSSTVSGKTSNKSFWMTPSSIFSLVALRVGKAFKMEFRACSALNQVLLMLKHSVDGRKIPSDAVGRLQPLEHQFSKDTGALRRSGKKEFKSIKHMGSIVRLGDEFVFLIFWEDGCELLLQCYCDGLSGGILQWDERIKTFIDLTNVLQKVFAGEKTQNFPSKPVSLADFGEQEFEQEFEKEFEQEFEQDFEQEFEQKSEQKLEQKFEKKPVHGRLSELQHMMFNKKDISRAFVFIFITHVSLMNCSQMREPGSDPGSDNGPDRAQDSMRDSSEQPPRAARLSSGPPVWGGSGPPQTPLQSASPPSPLLLVPMATPKKRPLPKPFLDGFFLTDTEKSLKVESSLSPGPGLNQGLNQRVKQEIPETSQIKEEPEEASVKQEEEQLPVCVPEYFAVCVKAEEQSEPKEETQGEDISTEPQFHTETEGDTEHSSDNDNDNNNNNNNDEDCEVPFICSDDEDHNNQDQATQNSGLSLEYKSAPESSATVKHGDKSGSAEGADGKTQQCPFCAKTIKGTKQSLERHIRIHTGERPFSCSICNKTFSTKYDLNVHIRSHTGEKPYSCSTCNKTFTTIGSLNAHRRTHTGEKPFSCSFCKREFNQVGGLNRHMRLHTGEKFSCPICEKEYTQLIGLKRHMSVHTGENTFSCSTCNKTFPTESSLSLHVRTHTGEKPYSCIICNKTFTQVGALNAHRRTHTGEKTFSCSICNKEFAHLSGLNRHMRQHTGEKPFSCSICNKTFSQIGNLNAHRRTHTGEKPFSCSICNKEFAKADGLKYHMRQHTGEKPFSCSICNKAFSHKSNLNTHIKIHKTLISEDT